MTKNEKRSILENLSKNLIKICDKSEALLITERIETVQKEEDENYLKQQVTI